MPNPTRCRTCHDTTYVLPLGGGDELPCADCPKPATNVTLPDRDDLAFELFNADNHRQAREQNRADFDAMKKRQDAAGIGFYVYRLADAAIEAFKRANP